MSPHHLVFPVIGLMDARPASASWELYFDLQHFSIDEPRRAAERVGMLIVDYDGRCWRIVSVRVLGVAGGFWERILLFLTRQSVHRLEQDLVELPDMTFDDVKARLCAAIQSNPDHWRDDDAIAGVDGPPREEQDLLDEMKACVMGANSPPELMSDFWEEDLSQITALAEKSRLQRKFRT